MSDARKTELCHFPGITHISDSIPAPVLSTLRLNTVTGPNITTSTQIDCLICCFMSMVNSYGHVGTFSYLTTVPGQAPQRQFTSIKCPCFHQLPTTCCS